MRGLALGPWELGALRAEAIRDLEGTIDVAPVARGVVGEIRNGTPLDLRHVVVIGEGDAISFADRIGPRSSGKVAMNPSRRALSEIVEQLPPASFERRAYEQALAIASGAGQGLAHASRGAVRGWTLVAAVAPAPPAEGAAPAPRDRAAVLIVRGTRP